MKNEEQFAGFKLHFWPLDQFGPETAQNGVPPSPHRRPPRVRQNDSVAAMHQGTHHHCRTLLPRVLAPATRRLALCSSKTMRQRCPSIHSLPTSLFTPSLALPLAPSVVAAIAGWPSSSCRCCQRYCCPSASRCPATQSLPSTAIAASPRRCNCRPRTAESTMAGWPSSPRRVSTAPSFLVSIRVNHQLRRPLLGLSSPSSALLHRRGELPPENSSCRRYSRRPRVAKPPWATSGRAEASGGCVRAPWCSPAPQPPTAWPPTAGAASSDDLPC